MRNLYICIILTLLSLSGETRVSAQTWKLKESGTVLKGSAQEILPLPGGGIVTVTHSHPGKKGPMTISRFDGDLIEIYSVRLSLLGRERYEAAWFYNDTLLLFTIDPAGGLTRYKFDIDNGSLTGQPLPLIGLVGIDQPLKRASFYTGGSPDSAFHYIASVATPKHGTAVTPQPETGALRGILLDRRGDEVTRFQHPFSSAAGPVACTQSNDGTLALISNHYTITTIDPDGSSSSFRLEGLPNDRMHNASWSMDGGTLCFSGWMNESGQTGLTTIVTGCVDLGTRIVFGLHQTEVKTLLTKTPQKGFPDQLTLLRSLPLPDGCRYLLFESSGQHLYQPRFSIALTSLNPSTQAVCYQSRGDVYVLKLDAANKPEWMNVLSKNQEEWNSVSAIGVGTLLDRENRLHVFFYDNKRNTDATAADVTTFRAGNAQDVGFACISITSEGAMKKQFILPTDNGYRLMPGLAFADNKDEACFLAMRTNRYKVGTIALK